MTDASPEPAEDPAPAQGLLATAAFTRPPGSVSAFAPRTTATAFTVAPPAPAPVAPPAPAPVPLPVPLPVPDPVPLPMIHPAALPSASVPEQYAATAGYRRFSREVSDPEVEDYYRGPRPAELPGRPPVSVAKDIAPTGAPGRSRARRRAGLMGAALLVAAGTAAAAWALTPGAAAPVAAPPVVVVADASGGGPALVLRVAAAATAGPSYSVTVPTGWRAESRPTRPGGAHLDVVVRQPVLGLTVTVRSEAATTAPRAAPAGAKASTATRVFGVAAPTVDYDDAGRHHRVASARRGPVRYVVDVSVPSASARQDAARVGAVLAGLGITNR